MDLTTGLTFERMGRMSGPLRALILSKCAAAESGQETPSLPALSPSPTPPSDGPQPDEAA